MTYTVEIPEGNPDMDKAFKLVMKALNISFKKVKEKAYNPKFVATLEKSIAQADRGDVHKIVLEDLWK